MNRLGGRFVFCLGLCAIAVSCSELWGPLNNPLEMKTPSDLVAAANNGRINLSWTSFPGATGYNIYRSTVAGAKGSKIGNSANTSYSDAGLASMTAYYYEVTATNGGWESGPSSQVAGVSVKPTDLVVSIGEGEVTLEWAAIENATGYNIYRSSSAGSRGIKVGSSSKSQFTDKSAVKWSQYYYSVTATNAAAESEASSLMVMTDNVFTFAGSTSSGNIDGAGGLARFNHPRGIATDGVNLYIADTDNNEIRKIVIATREVSTLAGSGSSGNADGVGAAARFNRPEGIATDGTNLYVADTNNDSIRRIVIATGEVTTLAGGRYGKVDGVGAAAQFSSPCCIAIAHGNLYVGEYYDIRKIAIATGEVTTIAGSAKSGNADGIGASASFNWPCGLTTDGDNLYVADVNNMELRKVAMATAEVTTIAKFVGESVGISGPSPGWSAPYAITLDDGNLYVSQSGGLIRKFSIASGESSIIAGGGSGASNASDGSGATARFGYPEGIATDGTSIYVCDRDNNEIRMIH